jgi:peptidoglycan/LPS O-acetylase OafA/YrhL
VPLFVPLLGHLGVELFFVLSGFLIGRILIRIARDGPRLADWGVFMVRRLMRTFPLYAVWVVVLVLVVPPADPWKYLRIYLSFTQSLAWPMPADDWFVVSWSLAIEEWFYLLFSASFLGGCALARRRGAWPVILAFIVVPCAARFLVPLDLPWDQYIRRVTLLRLDAIALGVATAKLCWDRPRVLQRWRWSLLAGALVLGAVVWTWASVVGRFEPIDLAWRSLVFPVTSLGFALLFPAALRLRIASRLAARAVRALSHGAYALYLTHATMLQLAWPISLRLPVPAVSGPVLALAASGILSWLSFRYFESPILARRPRERRPAPRAR